MALKFMYIPNDDTQKTYVDYDLWFKHLDTQLYLPTNENK